MPGRDDFVFRIKLAPAPAQTLIQIGTIDKLLGSVIVKASSRAGSNAVHRDGSSANDNKGDSAECLATDEQDRVER